MDTDERYQWMTGKIILSLKPKSDELKLLSAKEQNRIVITQFLNSDKISELFIGYDGSKSIFASPTPPPIFTGKLLTFVKQPANVVPTMENIDHCLQIVETTAGILHHSHFLVDNAFLPLFCAEFRSEREQNTVVGDRVFEQYLKLSSSIQVTEGNVQNKAVLAKPNTDLLKQWQLDEGVDRPGFVHLLESIVVNWIKHVKSILSFDVVKAVSQLYKHPTISDELATVQHHARDLERIIDHFNSEQVLEVFEMLRQSGSSYAASRTQIIEELQNASQETSDNLILLTTLEKCCKKLRGFMQQMDATQICNNIPPLVHTVLLMWRTSVYYHQTKPFLGLLEETANFVVQIAQTFVGAETKDVINNPEKSHDMLRDALRICAAFRGAYLDWKAKADTINETRRRENAEKLAHQPKDDNLFNTKLFGQFEFRANNPKGLKGETLIQPLAQYSGWPPRNAPCFDYMNAFMERCNDLLELVQTTDHFRRLSDLADQGGTGSASLDALVADVFAAYILATNEFFASVPNVLDIDCSRPFERAFYKLRLVVMELEDKLVAIMRAGFRQTATLSSRLCFTEIFGNVSSRKRIRDALTDEFTAITEGLKEEIASTRRTFQLGTKAPNLTPHQKNVPAFVSTLHWAESLKDRLVGVFEMTQRICPFILEDEEGWHIRDAYREVIADIDKFHPDPTKHWTDRKIEGLIEHLKQPVYVQKNVLVGTLGSSTKPVLSINISAEHSVLLREMVCLSKWFSENGDSQLPTAAKSVDWLRVFSAATRLNVISGTYNAIFSGTTELETQLFSDSFDNAHQLINEGCTTICWNMERLSDYIISLSTNLSSDLWQRVLTVRTCFSEVVQTTKMWTGLPLTVFAPGVEELEPVTWEGRRMAFLQLCSDLLAIRARDVLYPLGQRIQLTVETIFGRVQISRVSPAWVACTEEINEIVLKNLLQLCTYNLSCLTENFHRCGAFRLVEDQETLASVIAENLEPPFLTIELMLTQNALMFVPPLDKSLNKQCLEETMADWLAACFTASKHIAFITSSSDDDRQFDALLQQNPEIQELLGRIWAVIRVSVSTCKQIVPMFEGFSRLWEQDVAKIFEEFLENGKSSVSKGGSVKAGSRNQTRSVVPDSIPATPAAGTRATNGNSNANNEESSLPQQDPSLSREMTAASETRTVVSLTRHRMGHGGNNVIGPHLPTLDDFDQEMSSYKTMVDELQGMPDFHDCGFIRLDIRPIRDSLIVLASKSIYVYARFLIDHTVAFVDALREFLDDVEAKIDLLNENDFKSYKTLMNLVNQIQKKQAEVESKFPVLQRAVGMIQRYGHALPGNHQTLFSSSPSRWNAVKTKVTLAKQKLAPKIQTHIGKVTNELKEFNRFLGELWAKIENANLYTEEENVTFEQAFEQIENFNRQIRDIEDTAQDLKELQNFVEASVVDFDLITRAKKRLTVLERVWQCVAAFSAKYQDWCQQAWIRMNFSKLREDVAAEIKRMQLLPVEACDWAIVKSSEANAKIIEEYVPLLESVSNQAMRARHWKQLLRAINSAVFMDSDSIRTSTFGQMLDLGLQTSTGDVYHIVQRAVKDLKIEKSLKYLEEIWFGKLFELKPCSIHRVIRSDGSGEGRRRGTTAGGGMDSARAMTIDIMVDDRSEGAETKMGFVSASTLQPSGLNSAKPDGERLPVNGPMTIVIITRFEALYEEIESHQLQLQTILNDPLASSFIDEVTKWQQNLQHVESVLRQWQRVQQIYIQMQEVFAMDEVRVAFPTENHKFAIVSKEFINHMRYVEKNPNIFQNCNRANMLDRLESMGDVLNGFVKSLMTHVSRVQIEFPRMSLLSPLDCLRMISSGVNPDLLTGTIFKFLPSVQHLLLSEDHQAITGLVGHLGDRLNFLRPVTCQQASQVFADLLGHASEALKYHIPLALKALDTDSKTFNGLLNMPADILLTSLRIKFTRMLFGDNNSTDKARGGFNEALDQLIKVACSMLKSTTIDEFVESVRALNDPNPIVALILPQEIIKIQSIISLAVSYREFLSAKYANGSFEYDAFPKVAFDQERNGVTLTAVGQSVDYGFEFIGAANFQNAIFSMSPFTFATVFKSIASNTSPVCFLSNDHILTKSYVESLFGMFGHMLYAFGLGIGTNLNPDAANTSARISEIVQATIVSGAWVLFSEFQCLSPDLQLLAVASMNDQPGGDFSSPVGTLFFTADSNLRLFNGTTSATFPLPDSVRDKLRTLALPQPDPVLHTELFLLREGFTSAAILAKTLLAFLKFSSKLLGSDLTTHSRLGVRVLDVEISSLTSLSLLSAICRHSGEKLSQLNKTKSESMEEFESVPSTPGTEAELEELAVISAIEIVLLGQLERESSELLVSITPLFFHLSPEEYVKSANERNSSRMIPSRKSARPVNAKVMTSAFGRTADQFFSMLDLKLPIINAAVVKDERACGSFHEALFSAARRLNYNIELTTTLLLKLDQLQEMFHSYPFITVLGPACSGKTEAIKLFCAGMKQMGTALNIHSIYPASVDSARVFGDAKNLAKYESGSHSGLIPSTFEMLFAMNHNDMDHVLQIDGPLTPVLVEQLQDIIYASDVANMVDGRCLNIARQNCHVFWETDSLANLSPSVCSRMALISITREKSMVPLTLFHWIQRKPFDFQRQFFELFPTIFVPGMNKRADLCYATCWPMSNDLQILMAVMSFTKIVDGLMHMDIRKEGLFKKCIYFALYWAFGGGLAQNAREEFLHWMLTSFPDCPKDLDDLIPDVEKVDLVRVEASQVANLPVGIGISPESFIRTRRTEQLSYFVSLISDMGSPIAVIGRDGCGKTRTLTVKLESMCSSQLSDFDSAIVSSTMETDSLALFSALDRHVVWRHGQTYSPRSKRLVCFIDDLHLARNEPDTSAQTAAELIRQHVDDGGFNTPSDYSWRYIKGTTYILSLNPTPHSAPPNVSERLLWKFFFFHLAVPDRAEQFHIFSGLVHAHFGQSGPELKSIVNSLVSLSLDLISDLSTIFVPTLTRGHYLFSMHDLSRMLTFFCQSMNTELAQQDITNLFYLYRHELDWNLRQKLNSTVDKQKFDELYVSRVKKYITDKRYLEWLFEPDTPLFSSIITHENGMTNVALPTLGQIDEETLLKVFKKHTSSYRHYVLYDFYKHELAMDEDVGQLSGEAQNEWNKNYPNIEIFFYRQVLAVISRMARTVASSPPNGNVIMVADGYPGRAQFFATLGGSVAGLQIRTLPPVVPGASPREKLNEGLAALADYFFEAGCKEQKMLIIIRDEEFAQCPSLLARLCDFVTQSDLTSLFPADTQTNIVNAVRADATLVGQAHSKHAIWRFFERRVYENCRLCMIFNRVDATFWPVVRNYLQIFKQCNVFWLGHWSRAQLVEHGNYHFRTETEEEGEDEDEEIPDEWEWLSQSERENVCHLLADMHLTIRAHAATVAKSNAALLSGPFGNLTNTTFEYFVRRFLAILKREREHILADDETAKRIIERLRHDSDAATQLAQQLEIDLQIAEDKREGAAQLLTQIGQDKAIMELQLRTVKGHIRKLTYFRSQLPKYQMACERTLYKASQMVDDTKSLLKALDMTVLSELRSIQKPSEGMDDLMAGIIMVLKSPSADLTWQRGAKRQLANLERFIDELSSFNTIELSESTIKLLESHMKRVNDHREFLLSDARTSPLLRWLDNMIHYQKLVVLRVAPLQRRLNETRASVAEAETRLATLDEKRGAFDSRLGELARGFEEATVDKQEQEKKVTEMRGRLEDARGLRRLLDAEMARCEQIIASLPKRLNLTMFGRCAIAAATVAYLGPFQPKFRHEMLLYHWPICVGKRGLPLIFDRIDDIRGCIIEASVGNLFPDGSGMDERDEWEYFGGEVSLERFRPLSTAQTHARTSSTPLVEPPLVEHEDAEQVPDEAERNRRYLDAILRLLLNDPKVLEMQRLGLTRQRMENVAIMAHSQNRPVYIFSDWSKHNGDVETDDIKFAFGYEKVKSLVLAPKPEVISQLERHVIDGDVVVIKNAPRELDHLLMPLIQHHFVTINLREITILPVGKRKVISGATFEAYFTCVPSMPGEFERVSADGIPAFSPQVASMTSLLSYRFDEDTIKESLVVKSMLQLRPSIGRSLDSLCEAQAAFYEAAQKVAGSYQNLMERSDISVFSAPKSNEEEDVDMSFSHLLNSRYRIRMSIVSLDKLIRKLRLLAEQNLGSICERAAALIQMSSRLQSGVCNMYQKSFSWVGLDYQWFQLATAEIAPPPKIEQEKKEKPDEKVEEKPEQSDGEQQAGLASDQQVIKAEVGENGEEVQMIVDREKIERKVSEKISKKPSSTGSQKSKAVVSQLPQIPTIGGEIFAPFNEIEIAELEKAAIKRPMELICQELQPRERSLLLIAFLLNQDRGNSTFLTGSSDSMENVSKPSFLTKTEWSRLSYFFTPEFLRAINEDSAGWSKWFFAPVVEPDDLDVPMGVLGRNLTALEKAHVFGLLKPYAFTSFCQQIMSESNSTPSSNYSLESNLRTAILCPARASDVVLSKISGKVGEGRLMVIDCLGRTYLDELRAKLSSDVTSIVFVPNMQDVPRQILEMIAERHSATSFQIVVTIDPSTAAGQRVLSEFCIESSEPWSIIAYDYFLKSLGVDPNNAKITAKEIFSSSVVPKLQSNLRKLTPESNLEKFKLSFFLTTIQTLSSSIVEPGNSFELDTMPNVFGGYLSSLNSEKSLIADFEQFGRNVLQSTSSYSSHFEPRLTAWVIQKSTDIVAKFANARTPEDVASKLSESDFLELDDFLKEQRIVAGRRYFLKFVKMLDVDDSYFYDDPPVVHTNRLWTGLVIAHDCTHQIRNKKAKAAYHLAQDPVPPTDPWRAFMKTEAIKLCGLLDLISNDLAKLAKSILLDRFAIPDELIETATSLCQQLAPTAWIDDGELDLLFRENGIPLAWYLSQVIEARFELFESFSKLSQPASGGRITANSAGFVPGLGSLLQYFKSSYALSTNAGNPVEVVSNFDTQVAWSAKVYRGEPQTKAGSKMATFANTEITETSNTVGFYGHSRDPTGIVVKNLSFSVLLHDSMGTSSNRKFVTIGSVLLEPVPVSRSDQTVKIPLFSSTNAALTPVDFVATIDQSLDKAVRVAAGLDPANSLPGSCQIEAAYFAVLTEVALGDFSTSTGFLARATDTTANKTAAKSTRLQPASGAGTPGPVAGSPLAFVEQDTGVIPLLEAIISEAVTLGEDELSAPPTQRSITGPAKSDQGLQPDQEMAAVGESTTADRGRGLSASTSTGKPTSSKMSTAGGPVTNTDVTSAARFNTTGPAVYNTARFRKPAIEYLKKSDNKNKSNASSNPNKVTIPTLRGLKKN